MSRPLVSVLLVTYNHAGFIDRAIASIEAQVCDFAIEVVVADDHSDDGTRERVLDWAASSDLDVRVLPDSPRLGITLNYARGFAAVRGEFVAVLEGDDEWIWSEKLKIQADHLRAHPDRTMVANRVLLYDQARGSSTVVPLIGFQDFSVAVKARRLAELNWFATFSACMYRAEIIERIPARVFETTSYDWMVNLSVLAFGPAGFLPQVMTLYRQHGGGEWSSLSEHQRDVRIRDLLPEYIEIAPAEARPELTRTLHLLESRIQASGQESGGSDQTRPENDAPATGVPRVDGTAPRVSVVMPTHDHARWIEESVLSVLQQTMGDFELIIVDDASQDGTARVASRFSDSRIRLYRLAQNQGGAAALNFAIQQARGEFVAVINSDDAWETSKLERQLREFDEHPESIAVFTGARFVGENGKPLPHDEVPPWHDVFRQHNRSRAQWLRYFFDNGNALCHPSVLVRRRFYLDCGLYDNRMRQIPDLAKWIQLVKYGPIRVIGDEDLVRFRLLSRDQNASSSLRANVVRGLHEHLAIAPGFFEDCSDNLLVEGFGDVLVDPAFSSAEQRECEIALLWWNRDCPMQPINRIHALGELRRLLGDEDTALLLRVRYDIRDLTLHEFAGTEATDLPAAVERWLSTLAVPGSWRQLLEGVPGTDLARALWSRALALPPSGLWRKGAAVLRGRAGRAS